MKSELDKKAVQSMNHRAEWMQHCNRQNHYRWEVLKRWFAIDGVALNWFISYHDNCTQAFMSANVESVMYAINSSIPQGFLLVPLQFVAYA